MGPPLTAGGRCSKCGGLPVFFPSSQADGCVVETRARCNCGGHVACTACHCSLNPDLQPHLRARRDPLHREMQRRIRLLEQALESAENEPMKVEHAGVPLGQGRVQLTSAAKRALREVIVSDIRDQLADARAAFEL